MPSLVGSEMCIRDRLCVARCYGVLFVSLFALLLLLVFLSLMIPFPPYFPDGLVLLVLELMALCYPLSLSLSFFLLVILSLLVLC